MSLNQCVACMLVESEKNYLLEQLFRMWQHRGSAHVHSLPVTVSTFKSVDGL